MAITFEEVTQVVINLVKENEALREANKVLKEALTHHNVREPDKVLVGKE
jgi:regulator of replication initiation timing